MYRTSICDIFQSDHEEANTEMILHALDVTADGATHLSIHSLETDVLVLAIKISRDVCKYLICHWKGCQSPSHQVTAYRQSTWSCQNSRAFRISRTRF